MDFDVSAVLFDSIGSVIDAAYFKKPIAAGGKVIHSGDELTGVKEGDDETISINLKELEGTIFCIAIVISALPFQLKK